MKEYHIFGGPGRGVCDAPTQDERHAIAALGYRQMEGVSGWRHSSGAAFSLDLYNTVGSGFRWEWCSSQEAHERLGTVPGLTHGWAKTPLEAARKALEA